MPNIEKDINGKPISRNYEDFLSELLQDPREAKDYLNEALNEDEDHRVFLLALKDVAKSIGVSKIAKKTGLNREHIYKMLSEKGDPQISSLVALLKAVGIRFTIDIIEEKFEDFHEESFEVAATVSPKPKANYYEPSIVGLAVGSRFAKQKISFSKPQPFSAEARLNELCSDLNIYS